MEKYLQKYKDIDVVVSQNDDMTFGAIEAIRAAGKTTGTGGDITLISLTERGVHLKSKVRRDQCGY